MQMRRGWAGLVVLGVLLGGCEDGTAPGGGTGGEGESGEETLTDVAIMECPVVSPAAARADTFTVLADSSRVVHLAGAGRAHSLWIMADDVPRRTVVVREMAGTANGVDIDISPDPEAEDVPWAMLTLDARDCARGSRAIIVRRLETGAYTRPDGGFATETSTAYALLRGNSGYMLATPTKGPPPEP